MPSRNSSPVHLDIIKWPSGSDIVSPESHSVTLDKTERSYNNGMSGYERVRFMGTYMSVVFDGLDKCFLLMGGGNSLYYPTTDAGLGAQHAYFRIGDITLTPSSSSKGEGSGYWHILDGRQLTSKPTRGGVYVKNDRKVVIQ